MESPDHEKRAVIEYLEGQAADEQIEHLEKIASQRVLANRYDVWDVHTDVNRWWVITPMTNLYSQGDFKSMDTALTFHIGLVQRLTARNLPSVSKDEYNRSAGAWRKWEQAADALDEAEEAEDFQAVGMRLREGLLTFMRGMANEEYVPEGQVPPKGADFVRWSELIANALASGDSASKLRSYLKNTAKVTWELVQWLTHATNATREDAHVAVRASDHLAACYLAAYAKFEGGAPPRCPKCSSYRLVAREIEGLPVMQCRVCGWDSVWAEDGASG